MEIAAEDEGVVYKGKIDVLVIFEQVWVTVIESKQAAFSPEVGKPQLLAYTLTTSNNEQPTYGLITNGSSFRFFKLVKGEMPQYPLSKLFDIFNPGNELYSILRVLKQLAQLATSS